MCTKNFTKHSCGHIILNTVMPFTLCENADGDPIPRQCKNVVYSIVEDSKECDICNDAKGEVKKEARKLGDRGQNVWRDDVPQ